MEFENQVLRGGCLEVLKDIPDETFDSCVVDPPYGLGREPTVEEIIAYLQGSDLVTGDFMGKNWDIPSVLVWREVFRVLKPGGHVLSFGGTRTFDLISLGLRSAGFENRDTIADNHPGLQWVQGQGMPKSTNISKQIDKKVGSVTARSQSVYEPSQTNAWCLCADREEADCGMVSRVGDTARQASGHGSGSPDGASSRQVGGTVSEETSPEVRVGPVPDAASRRPKLCELRDTHPKTEESSTTHQDQEAVLHPRVCLSGPEEAGHGEVGVRAGLEESSSNDSSPRQELSGVRKESPGKRTGSTRPSSEAVSVRRNQRGQKSRGSVRSLSSHDRESDLAHPGLDTNRCELRRVIPDDSGRWGHSVARVCSWCGHLDQASYGDLRGLGTGLKPTWEPILVFRKPFSEKTLSENVLKYGTGAINIDACRVKHSSPEDLAQHKAGVEAIKARGGAMANSWKNSSDLSGANEVTSAGRWPSNLVLAHAEGCNQGPEDVTIWACVPGCPVAALDAQSGATTSGAMKREVGAYKGESTTGFIRGRSGPSNQHGDKGGASRFFPQFVESPFFYTGKASKRETTLDGEIKNHHPTKKPLALMRWLVKLVTPKGGIVLDPYAGSGSTLHAAVEEGMRFTGVERDPDFCEVARHRMEVVCGRAQDRQGQADLFDLAMSGDRP